MNNVPTLKIATRGPVRPPRGALSDDSADSVDPVTCAERLLCLHEQLMGSTEIDALMARFQAWAREHDLAQDIVFAPGGAAPGEHSGFGTRRGRTLDFVLTPGDTRLGSVSIVCRECPDDHRARFMARAVSCLSHYLDTAFRLQSLQEMAMYDGLTGLLNRKSLDARLAEEVSRARRHGDPLSVMLIDVDHFKALNDQLGHLSGDHTLRLLANIFTAVTRESDLAFRFGGDEFAILLPSTELRAARCTADRIRARLEALPATAFCIAGEQPLIRPDISVGIAQRRKGDTETELLRRADTHLYQAKAEGRGRICTHV